MDTRGGVDTVFQGGRGGGGGGARTHGRAGVGQLGSAPASRAAITRSTSPVDAASMSVVVAGLQQSASAPEIASRK